jgi:hypothetical protein
VPHGSILLLTEFSLLFFDQHVLCAIRLASVRHEFDVNDARSRSFIRWASTQALEHRGTNPKQC